MKQIYLIDGNTYTFYIYNDYFGHRELIVEDSAGDEITSGVTNTWAFKSGKEYTGNVTRIDGKVYAENTDKEIQKIKIEFTPTIGGNLLGDDLAYLRGRTGSDLQQEMKAFASAGSAVNPNREKFIIVFSRSDDFNYNTELKDLFLSSMIPAGLIPEERLV